MAVTLLKWRMRETSRTFFFNLLILLSLLNTSLFVWLMLTGMALRSRFDVVLPLIRGLDHKHLHNLATFAGMAGAIYAFLSLFLAWMNLSASNRRLGNKVLTLFSFLNLLFIGLLIYLLTAFDSASQALGRNMNSSFQEAMAGYTRMASRKVMVDMTQQHFHCCGSSSYEDWFNVDWIEAKHTRDGHDPRDTTPFSCCDPLSPRACIFFNVRGKSHENYSYQKDLTLFKTGCQIVVSEHFKSFVHTMIKLPTYCLLPSLLLCFFLSRFCSTSIAAAIATGHPAFPAPGHLLAFGELPVEKIQVSETSIQKLKDQLMEQQAGKKKKEGEDEESEDDYEDDGESEDDYEDDGESEDDEKENEEDDENEDDDKHDEKNQKASNSPFLHRHPPPHFFPPLHPPPRPFSYPYHNVPSPFYPPLSPPSHPHLLPPPLPSHPPPPLHHHRHYSPLQRYPHPGEYAHIPQKPQ